MTMRAARLPFPPLQIVDYIQQQNRKWLDIETAKDRWARRRAGPRRIWPRAPAAPHLFLGREGKRPAGGAPTARLMRPNPSLKPAHAPSHPLPPAPHPQAARPV
jgi:hypothetical protein